MNPSRFFAWVAASFTAHGLAMFIAGAYWFDQERQGQARPIVLGIAAAFMWPAFAGIFQSIVLGAGNANGRNGNGSNHARSSQRNGGRGND